MAIGNMEWGKPIVLAIFACFFPFSVSVADVQQPISCDERLTFVKELSRAFGEKPVATALTNGGLVLEVFASQNGETWTILITAPDGCTFGLADGIWWTGYVQGEQS